MGQFKIMFSIKFLLKKNTHVREFFFHLLENIQMLINDIDLFMDGFKINV